MLGYVIQPGDHIVMGVLPHLHYIGDPLVRCHVVWDSMAVDQTPYKALCKYLGDECWAETLSKTGEPISEIGVYPCNNQSLALLGWRGSNGVNFLPSG